MKLLHNFILIQIGYFLETANNADKDGSTILILQSSIKNGLIKKIKHS